MSSLTVVGSFYRGPRKTGDFHHMIQSGLYENALFIYNDNEEHYRRQSFYAGKGNAVIRKFNKYNPEYKDNPMSAGIPTGSFQNRGYASSTPEVKQIIDDCIEDIRQIIRCHNKKVVYYSASEDHDFPLLGTSLFKVGIDVRQYITDQLRNLV